MVKTTAFFFESRQSRLYGMTHLPKENVRPLGLVFCHPFGEERIRVHRIYFNLANLLAEEGYPVLRFDYAGYGDSEGDWENVSVEMHLSDINAAVNFLLEKTEIKNLGLFGVRFGATLACVAAEETPAIDYLVLWEPILNVWQYLYEKLRVNLATQVSAYRKVLINRDQLIESIESGGSANIDGYELSNSFYSTGKNIDLLTAPRSFAGNVLIAKIAPNDRSLQSKSELEQLLSLYRNVRKSDLILSKAEPFWDLLRNYLPRCDHLFSQTLAWLNENAKS